MSTDRSAVFCLRWVQHLPSGNRHWYLRRLAADRRFWGYVHVRTTAEHANRDFSGTFPAHVWESAQSLIARIRNSGPAGIAPSEFSDAALIEGTAGTETRLVSCNLDDCATSDAAKAFYELVAVLEPHVAAAVP